MRLLTHLAARTRAAARGEASRETAWRSSSRKPSLTPARAAELQRRVADGDSKAALAREFGISRDTLYRYVPVKKRRAGKLGK
ncbi:helix-turn-helix domain-containing protein [Edaphobacter aggregans]|uniref:helix-turn-helix domain-containing protein n=1 Tax=Edaphobacter aggregans TaxID=570835 RepID=UPI002480FA65|nr:helix-turn-helix domain-containing protein [Edaphobacter aggregans]